ncbi:alpha-amylase family glycosyl hydrolase [Cohnella soli]|uniref:Alpha-amylase family glycosyl hydrolase n=1 Tax=Cohnella soli TaxID=425005 RepID=A0ABW0I2G2_9BACL
MINYVEHRRIRIGYDAMTGQPLSMSVDGREEFAFSRQPVRFDVDGESGPNNEGQMINVRGTNRIGEDGVLESVDFKPGAADEEAFLKLNLLAGTDWRLSLIFRIGESDVSLQVNLANLGAEKRVIRSLKWIVEGLGKDRLGDCEILMPGYAPEADLPYELRRKVAHYPNPMQFASERPTPYGSDEPGNRSGIMGVYDAKENAAALTWWASDVYPMKSRLLRIDDQVLRESTVYCPCLLAPGETLEVGTFYFGRYSGDRVEAVRQAARSFGSYRYAGQELSDRRKLSICEIQIGEKMGRTVFSSYDDAIRQIPYIRELGYNALEVMPRFPFPSYSVYDFFDIDTTFGDRSGLRNLVKAARNVGIKVIIDIVFHGPLEEEPKDWCMPEGDYRFDSPYLEGHPEWFSRHENGEFARTYTRSFDLSNPELQKHIADAMIHLIRELDIDGFRLDAQTWNFFPNWDPLIDRPAYEALYAGYRMMEGIGAKVAAAYPGKIMYTEGCGPLVARYHPYRYNYDYHWIYPAMANVTDPRGMSDKFWRKTSENTLTWRDLAEWLEEAEAAMPEGISVVHQTDSHDSHEWAGFHHGQFNREAFGPEAHRVLVGTAAFMNGGFMSFYGAEQGNEAFYRSIMGIREHNETMAAGECNYRGIVASDPRIIAILWTYRQRWLLFIANPDNDTKRVELSIGELRTESFITADSERWKVCDLMQSSEGTFELNGSEMASGWPMKLDGYGVYVLEGIPLSH